MTRLAIGLLFLLSALGAFAHDPGLSSVHLQLEPGNLSTVLTYNESDISTVIAEDPEAVRQGGSKIQSKLDALARRALSLEVGGVQMEPASTAAKLDQNKNVEFTYSYPWTSGVQPITVRSQLVPEMPFGHRQSFVALGASGNELARGLFSSRETTATFVPDEAAGPPSSHTFLDFFLLGIQHILTGYDHLLFLFGLLIVCRNLRQAALLITCFTVAHSLTLALSTFGLVQLPSRWIEAAIAASIVYVGLENLLRGDGKLHGRWLLTFAFGLIHGMGFAGVLREMGVADGGLSSVAPLAGFNLGVEAGQLCIAAILLPILLWLRKTPRLMRVAIPVASIVVAAAGGCWLVQRVFFS
ncbi:MAG: HupE/UreJ family protein [Verrucomicrobiota bacterium]|nr:HupE/UreJ family protein [Chthoniobacterales bacterium]MDQ3414221.1 HupE/UreJ family protein [Verrucomicrobiota bacterium]